MTPDGLKECLFVTMGLDFDEEPPYDAILDCLKDCFVKY